MFSTKIVAFTTMVLLVTKLVLSECICFLRSIITNINNVDNNTDRFETPHTTDQALYLLLTDTHFVRIHFRVAAVIMQNIFWNKMSR